MYFFLLFFLLNTITYSGTVNSKQEKPLSLTLTIPTPYEGLLSPDKNNLSCITLSIGYFNNNNNCEKTNEFLAEKQKRFDLKKTNEKENLIKKIKKLARIEFQCNITREGHFNILRDAFNKYKEKNPHTIDPEVIFEILNKTLQLDPYLYNLGKEVNKDLLLPYQNHLPTAQLSGPTINNIVLIPFHKLNSFSQKITPFIPNKNQQIELFFALIMKYNGLLNRTATKNSLKIIPDLSKKPNRVETFMQNPKNKNLLNIFFPALEEKSNEIEKLAQENNELDALLDELEKIAKEDTK